MKQDLAKLHRDVAFGKSGGKIIWQPRIGCWYTDKKFAGISIPHPYTDMDVPGILRHLGCSARLYGEYNRCFKAAPPPGVRHLWRELGGNRKEHVIETPVGKQVEVIRLSENNPHRYHIKWEVETEEELKVATWRTENTDWEWDQDVFDEAQKEVGDLGAPTIFMPRMNVQDLYINSMGVEKGVYALYDMPDAIEAYFRALDESHDRLIELINASPIEIINFGENIHAGTLSPDLFVKYHLPACQRRSEKLHAAGKFVHSHWDGDCGPLLPYARDTGLDGIEAITPEPQGDVTLEEIKEGLGNELFLIDGIPAIYFDETFPVDDLIRCTYRLIELFAPKLILGISDEISSSGDIERIRVVGDIVDRYNASVNPERAK